MPTLQDFIEDELFRAPMVFDQAVDAVLQQWRAQMPGQALRGGPDPIRALQSHRGELVEAALRHLRQSAQAAAAAMSQAAGAQAPTYRLELSLLDEDQVAVDIEMARTIDAIRTLAENELRNLQAYTSALVGDTNVSRDTNPFKPDAYAAALGAGVQQIPLSRGMQAAFLREAAGPLARVVVKAYAAACQRLKELGIEPAIHRTIVFHGGSRAVMESTQADLRDLSDLRDSMPMPLEESPPSVAAGPVPASALRSSQPTVDQQLIELLSRLFDSIQADRHLSSPTLGLLLRLHPTALRAALHDPSMLDTYEHPVWQFMDRLAFLLETCVRSELDRATSFSRNLIDDLVADSGVTVDRFQWSLGRIAAFERNLLEKAVAEVAPQVHQLLERDLREAADTTTSPPPLDIATLDTVPAGLMTVDGEADTPIGDCQAGDWLRAYLQGDWRNLLLLWRGQHRQTWLLLDSRSGQHLTLQRGALDRLAAEGLAGPLAVRSLVRNAAARVLRKLGTKPG